MSDTLNSTNNDLDLGELIAALWAHKIIIVAITLISIGVSGYNTIKSEKKYTAKSIFQINEQEQPGFNFSGELGALASLAGFSSGITNSSRSLIERVTAREFIINASKVVSLENDPYFNTFNPNYEDPLWKAQIKKIIGWQKTKVDQKAIIENNVISGFNSAVEIKEKDSGALVISVTHNNAQKASNMLMLLWKT